MADDSNSGVSVKQMQEYLNLDEDIDVEVLKDFIDMAEEDIMGAINPEINVEKYRSYKLFNQAVKVLVDFNYFNRGNLATVQLAYPPSYAYMVNGIRWKIRRAENENSSQPSQ